jgi:23S rRNA pseudouridine1911/1915/1917 synthase
MTHSSSSQDAPKPKTRKLVVEVDAGGGATGGPVAQTTEQPAEQRLDVFLATQLGISRSQVRKLLARGAVCLAGRELGLGEKGRVLKVGDELEVATFRRPEEQRILPDGPRRGNQLSVLAEGQGWLAVDKAAGTPVHPLREDERGTVLNALMAHSPEIQGVGEGGLRSGVVHRLDVDTSGVLLVAIHQTTWERFRLAFQEHRIRKFYRAVVHGALSEERTLEVGLRITRHRPALVKVVPVEQVETDSSVRVTALSVRPLEALRDATLVEVRPTTGFLHQIRATLAHIGHPLVGDATYGAQESAAGPPGVPRHLLHATRLAFEEVDVESSEPEDFLEMVDALRRAPK